MLLEQAGGAGGGTDVVEGCNTKDEVFGLFVGPEGSSNKGIFFLCSVLFKVLHFGLLTFLKI